MLDIDANVENLYACGETMKIGKPIIKAKCPNCKAELMLKTDKKGKPYFVVVGGYVVKCGKCGCEYDTQFHNGCPQCGFGKTRTVNIYSVKP